MDLKLIKDSFIFLNEKFKNVEILKKIVLTEEDLEKVDKNEIFFECFYKHAKRTLNQIKNVNQ